MLPEWTVLTDCMAISLLQIAERDKLVTPVVLPLATQPVMRKVLTTPEIMAESLSNALGVDRPYGLNGNKP